MRGENRNRGLEERVLRVLMRSLEGAAWTCLLGGGRGPELVCRKDGKSYVVELKGWGARASQGSLRSLLADAVLRSRSAAAAIGAEPLAVVAAPKLSRSMAEGLRSYMEVHAPEMAWGMVDEDGHLELHGAGLDDVQAATPPPSQSGIDSAPTRKREVHNPFSDLGQWMLKVLLAPRVPPEFLAAPRQPVGGVQDLADRAVVSAASASKFVASLRGTGFLESSGGALRLVRLRELMELWRAAARPVPGGQVVQMARFLFPVDDPDRQLAEALARRPQPPVGEKGRAGPPGQRLCLARFSACGQLGLRWMRGVEPAYLYSEDLSPQFLERLGLRPIAVEGQGRADVLVYLPRFPEALFRGCVMRGDVPVADALQCWVDLRDHPARGAEQAQEILDRLKLKLDG